MPTYCHKGYLVVMVANLSGETPSGVDVLCIAPLRLSDSPDPS